MVLTSYHVIPQHFYSVRTETEVGGEGAGGREKNIHLQKAKTNKQKSKTW